MIPIGFLASAYKPWSGLTPATFDATLGNNTTSNNNTTYNFSTSNLGSYYAGRVIVISAFTNGTDAETTCTVGGQSATKIASVGSSEHLFYYTGTLTGSQTVAVTIAGGANYMNGFAYRITAPYQSTPFAYSSASGTGAISTSISLCPSGGLLFFFCASSNNSVITTTYSGSESVTDINNGTFSNGNLYALRQRVSLTSDGSRSFTTNNTTATKYATMVVFR